MTDRLIINDPVYGFTEVPRGLLCDIIKHPYFQRLHRIRQLGLAGLVYPGAQHTRFLHSLGSYHLMHRAIESLTSKGVFIFDSEVEAVEAAILMHDLGHGPFSHVLEKVFIDGVSHEDISLMMMEEINNELHGQLNLAIKIFKDDYGKRFLHELICSQLDMDRMDYLCRDSFFTGVREGNIGAERIIQTLNVHDDRLVVEQKGLLSVENYLMARRLMYWQVYLHKTATAGEAVLIAALRRAKELAQRGVALFASPALRFFLYNQVDAQLFHSAPKCLEHFAELDDSDVINALKVWRHHDDRVLSILADSFINRRLFKVEVLQSPPSEERLLSLRAEIAHRLGISDDEAAYFVCTRRETKEMYSATADGIGILYPDESVRDVASVSSLIDSETADCADHKLYLYYMRTD